MSQTHKVPGVTEDNLYSIKNVAPTLLQLSMLSVVELKGIVGQKNARQIFQFFNDNVLM